MIMQFPVAHDDELLVSILARFVARQGLIDDKVALETLFGSRNIVPSALLQGHIQALLSHVGHIWPINEFDVIHRHSILPFFQTFVEPLRIKEVLYRLIHSDKSHVMTSIGVNASSIKWSRYYRYCPECLADDHNKLAYSYWRRLFQLPGVHVCPTHYCYLQNSPHKLLPQRRHSFWDASSLVPQEKMTPIHISTNDKLSNLSITIQQLLNTHTPYVSPLQWTAFYRRHITDVGLMVGFRPDHTKIKGLVNQYWGHKFLEQHGLCLSFENNWLLALFRKQRRHYCALHHIVCTMALFPDYSFLDLIKNAALIPVYAPEKRIYTNINASERANDYRINWKAVCAQFATLKDIRATTEGARVYSWLYRFDNAWLQDNLPIRARNDLGRQVNWKKRDIELAKKLIQLRNTSYENLCLPRMTQTWFIANINVSWGVSSHLHKLPLCKSFFVKYTESIDEYQIRRVLAIIVKCISMDEPIPQPYEIERIAGLSKERSREPVKQILGMDFEKFSRLKLSSKQYRTQKD